MPEHAARLGKLLRKADPPITHAYIAFPHLKAYFDAHCSSMAAPADSTRIGDWAEHFCDVSRPYCMTTTQLYNTVKRHVPKVGFLGGVAFKHAGLTVNSSSSRIHDSYADALIIREGDSEVHTHACDAVCTESKGRSNYANVACHPGEGVAIAWEVLRSAELVSCPSGWECDPLHLKTSAPQSTPPPTDSDMRCYEARYLDLGSAAGGDIALLRRHWEGHGRAEGRDPYCEGVLEKYDQ